MKLSVTLSVCPSCGNSFVPSIDKDGSGLSTGKCPECGYEIEVRQTVPGNAKTTQVKRKRVS
jgi:DNA-directed RNA polymerase subunit M/transcription elongation factor TFIIS